MVVMEAKDTLEVQLEEAIGVKRLAEKDLQGPTGPIAIETADGGMVAIYDTQTGERRNVLRYLLPQLLVAKHQEGAMKGQRRFSARPVPVTVRQGTLKCWLHPGQVEREHYDVLGFPTCRKSNLVSEYAVELHVKNRHPHAYSTIMAERKAAKEQEDRDFQRGIMTQLAQVAAGTTGEAEKHRRKRRSKAEPEPATT